MFYGNGTSRLVRDSLWRDKKSGVLNDLGSHLLDTCRFWFGDNIGSFELLSANRFENKSPDHVVIVTSDQSQPRIELEMTLCMWRNHFTCDILAENGTAHIESLCKWGPSKLTVRKRVYPSGRPIEEEKTVQMSDPTWVEEYDHFNRLCCVGGTNLDNDVWISSVLSGIGETLGTELPL